MKAHEAQPHNLPDHQMLLMLTDAIAMLVKIHGVLSTNKPRRAAKEELRRQLAGVVGRVETINLALK